MFRGYKAQCCFRTLRNWGKELNELLYELLLFSRSIFGRQDKKRLLAMSSQKNMSQRSTGLIKLKYLNLGDMHQTKEFTPVTTIQLGLYAKILKLLTIDMSLLFFQAAL